VTSEVHRPTRILSGTFESLRSGTPKKQISNSKVHKIRERAAIGGLDDLEPWVAADAVKSGLVALVGLIGLLICWYELAGTPGFHAQRPWMVGAAVSTIVAALGLVYWLTAGFLSVRRAERLLLAEIQEISGRSVLPAGLHFVPSPSGIPTYSTQDQVRSDAFVWSAPMTRVHRPGCLLIQGKTVRPVDLDEIDRLGLSLCGVCSR
jgi:hypothetical protein